jgi:hypothetical protein
VAYTLPEVVELLGTSADKILKHVEAGKLHPMIVNGQDYFFSAGGLTLLGTLLGSSRTRATTQSTQPAIPSPDAEFYSVRQNRKEKTERRPLVRRFFVSRRLPISKPRPT